LSFFLSFFFFDIAIHLSVRSPRRGPSGSCGRSQPSLDAKVKSSLTIDVNLRLTPALPYAAPMADAAARASKALRDNQKRHPPLEKLDAARRLREAAEALEQEAVVAARAAGQTWTQVAAVYGMSKQAAQQRFRPRPH
jgi:hypothetical protein